MCRYITEEKLTPIPPVHTHACLYFHVFITQFSSSSFFKYFNHPCASAVSHARNGDGLSSSLLSLLLELLRPPVEEGKTLKVNTASVLSEDFFFLAFKIFYLFSSSGRGNPELYPDEQELDLIYFWRVRAVIKWFYVCLVAVGWLVIKAAAQIPCVILLLRLSTNIVSLCVLSESHHKWLTL